ncbi:hypothetical protein D3C78_1314060 [compost metagenome]
MSGQHPVSHPAATPELNTRHNLVVRALFVERVRDLVTFDQLELDRQRSAAVEAQVVDLQEDLASLLPGAHTKSHEAIGVQHPVEVGGRAEFLFPEPIGCGGKGFVLRLGARLDTSADFVADPVADAVVDPAVVPCRVSRPSAHRGELADHGSRRTGRTGCPAFQAGPSAGRIVAGLGGQRGAADLKAATLEGFEIHQNPLLWRRR